jgi:hypothetical protein
MHITAKSHVDRTELYSCTLQNNSYQLYTRVPIGDIPYVAWLRAMHAMLITPTKAAAVLSFLHVQ